MVSYPRVANGHLRGARRHDTTQCYLRPPETEPLLTEETYVVTLQMRDKFGNNCCTGGAIVSAKLGCIKQGVADDVAYFEQPQHHG